MHTSSRVVIAFAAVAISTLGCTSQTANLDSGSETALKKADPLAISCSYIQTYSRERTGQTTVTTTDTPKCDDTPCGDVHDPYDPATSEYDWDLGYNHDEVEYVGTCSGARDPVTCDDLASDGNACDACVATSCCWPAYLCSHDPNCQAIIDCVTSCQNDSCIDRCIGNADPTAAESYSATTECLSGRCASDCK